MSMDVEESVQRKTTGRVPSVRVGDSSPRDDPDSAFFDAGVNRRVTFEAKRGEDGLNNASAPHRAMFEVAPPSHPAPPQPRFPDTDVKHIARDVALADQFYGIDGVQEALFDVESEDAQHTAPATLQTVLASQRRVESAIQALLASQRSLASRLDGVLPELRGGGGDGGGLGAGLQSSGGRGSLTGQLDDDAVNSLDEDMFGTSWGFVRPSMMTMFMSSVEALPKTWPSCLRPRPELRAAEGDGEVDENEAASRVLSRQRVAACYNEGDDMPKKAEKDGIKQWLRNPASPLQFLTSMAGLLFLLHDLTFIPVVFAWDLECEGYVLAAMVASAVFWTLEMGANALKSRYIENHIQLEPLRASVCRYLKTWFCPDAAVVTADWLSIWLAVARDQKHAGALRFAKMVRLLRVTRAFRAMHLRRSVQHLVERVLPDHLHKVFYLAGLMFFGLWVCHAMACAWFAVARYADTDTGERWVDRQVHGPNHEPINFLDCSLAYQYLEAFRWAIEHLVSLESNEFPPTNAAEEMFGTFGICAGFIFGSLLISALSTHLIEFEALHRERSQNMRLLRRYLFQNAVAPDVTAHVLEQAHMRLSTPKWLDEGGVPVLSSLSGAVISKLRHSICAPYLLAHPLLRVLDAMDDSWFRHLSHVAVRISIVSPEDEVFAANAPAVAAYHVIGGLLTYAQDPKSAPVEQPTTRAVELGAWVAESALWSDWIHMGTMSAVRHSKVIVLQTGAFLRTVRRHRAISNIVQAYAHAYHQRLVAAGPPLVSWPDDIKVPFTGFAELVYDMPHDISRAISLQVLDPLKDTPLWRFKGIRELQRELEAGNSALVLDSQGQPLRITSVVALQVGRHQDHRVLWELGRFEEGTARADLKMPGGKRHKGEPVQRALDRLLGATLQPLAGKLEATALRQESTDKASKEFSVQTRYIKIVFSAILRGTLDAPFFEVREAPRRTSRRPSTWTTAEVAPTPSSVIVPERFLTCPVFAFGRPSNARAYAWLLPEEAQELSTKQGQQILEAWVASLVPLGSKSA